MSAPVRMLCPLIAAACLALPASQAHALSVDAGPDLFLSGPGPATLQGDVPGRAPVAFDSGDGNGPTENAFVYYNSQVGAQWSPPATIVGQGVMGWPGDFVEVGSEVYGIAIANQQLFRVLDFPTAQLAAVGPQNPGGPYPRVGSLTYEASSGILFGADYISQELVEIDISNGAMSTRWDFASQNGLQEVRGLASANGLIYVYDRFSHEIYSFDLTTNILTLVSDVDTDVFGADTVPEPWFDEIAFFDGELYGMLHYEIAGLLTQQLRHIDLSNGATTDIGPEWLDQSLHALLIESMPEEVLWSVMSGPGNVTFTDASSPQTTADFDTEGTYVLELTVFDSGGPLSDLVTVDVGPAPTPTATPTSTPTGTPTGTPTATPDTTPTNTPTASPTSTPSSTPTASPTSTPSSTPSAPIVLCEMDFEGADCLDTGGDTCTANNGYNDDFASPALSGLKSGFTQGDDDFTNMKMNTDCAVRSKVTVDFKLQLPNGSNPNRVAIIGLQRPDFSWGMDFAWQQSTSTALFRCGDGPERTLSSTFSLNPGTIYNIRMDFESDGTGSDCAWYVDTNASGDWGTGGVDSGTLTSSDASSDIGGIVHHETGDGVASIIDDIGICDATGGHVAEGTKCGSNGVAPTPTATPTATPATTPTSTPTATPTSTPTATPTATPTGTPTSTPTATPTPTPIPEPGLIFQFIPGGAGLVWLKRRRRRKSRKLIRTKT